MATAKKLPRAPVLDKDLELVVLDETSDLELEQKRIEGCTLGKARSDRVSFDGVHVVGGSLSESHFERVNWLDVLVERADLSVLDWPAAKLARVEMRTCRATGARWTAGELDNVKFVDCQLDYATFAKSRFRHVVFERCRLREADFSEADLTGTSFVGCELNGVDFTRATLSAVDVSASTLTQARLSAGDVRGLIVSREQVIALAPLFGLVVRDA
jgi:uncharacterized protein YjbI with pentapeptide repeats